MFNSKTDSIVSNSVSASINNRIEAELKAKLNSSFFAGTRLAAVAETNFSSTGLTEDYKRASETAEVVVLKPFSKSSIQ